MQYRDLVNIGTVVGLLAPMLPSSAGAHEYKMNDAGRLGSLSCIGLDENQLYNATPVYGADGKLNGISVDVSNSSEYNIEGFQRLNVGSSGDLSLHVSQLGHVQKFTSSNFGANWTNSVTKIPVNTKVVKGKAQAAFATLCAFLSERHKGPGWGKYKGVCLADEVYTHQNGKSKR
jgi:hypothetical protein